MRSGSDTEMTSGFGGEEARLDHGSAGHRARTRTAARVARAVRHRRPSAQAERHRRERAAARRDAGRAPGPAEPATSSKGGCSQPGTNEIVVGRAASRQFSDLTVASTVKWGKITWQVVGIFDAGGSVAESEIWCDAKVLQPRLSARQLLPVGLSSGWSPSTSFQTFKDALTTNPRLSVTVIREPDYYAQQSQVLQTIIRTIGFGIAVSDGRSARSSARVNTMYSAVAAARARSRRCARSASAACPVVVSVLVEAVAAQPDRRRRSAALLAWAAFDGYQTATMNWQSFSQVAFAFAVTPALLARGLALRASVMGFIGGLFPAIRAARLPVVTALRQL